MLETLAKSYLATVRLPDANEAVELLPRVKPDHVPGLLLRSELAGRLRRPEGAEADARRAAELRPESATAQAALARTLNRRGLTREAVQRYELAVRLALDDAGAARGPARALVDSGEPDAAAAGSTIC